MKGLPLSFGDWCAHVELNGEWTHERSILKKPVLGVELPKQSAAVCSIRQDGGTGSVWPRQKNNIIYIS